MTELFVKPTVAILCGFNTNDLTSVLYDLVHLTIVAHNNFNISDIHILTDNVNLFNSFYKKEMFRLEIKNKTVKHMDLTELKVVDVLNNKNYLEILNNLLKQYEDKQILFSLSSHGYSGVTSTNNSDSDGRDEYILINGTMVLDNDLFNAVSKLSSGTTMLSLVDTCASGTMMDLRYVSDIKNNKKYEENQSVCNATVYMFSACRDSEFDSDSFSDKYGYDGGLSSVFLDYMADKTTFDVNNFVQYIKNTSQINSLFSCSKNI